MHRKLALAQNGTSENNEWIVVFRKGHTVLPDLSGLGQIRYVFEKALNAMVVSNISRDGILYLLKHNAVLLVEQVRLGLLCDLKLVSWLARIDEHEISPSHLLFFPLFSHRSNPCTRCRIMSRKR